MPPASPQKPFRLPPLRGTQIGLRDPSLIDRLKEDMRSGRFLFADLPGKIGGVVDRRMVYHVVEGHHRVVAALEIYREDGDTKPIEELLRWGCWVKMENAPHDSRPLPSRSWWGSFRNWLGL